PTGAVMITPRHRMLIFAFIMSCFMSLLMSGVITLINTGLDWQLPLRWLKAWIIAWAVAFPLISFIAPLSHRLTDKIMTRLSPPGSNTP
ncbi:MAG: DUF2798 domain-containing protein, partial [Alcanivoracaceae bacterium]|nr:DUF2798 domain-containing protein [Alcanivoracaceae bacterium]